MHYFEKNAAQNNKQEESGRESTAEGFRLRLCLEQKGVTNFDYQGRLASEHVLRFNISLNLHGAG